MDRQSILRAQQQQNIVLWSNAMELLHERRDILFGERRVAWYADGAFHLTMGRLYSKALLAQLNYAYTAIIGERFSHNTRRWPQGPRVFYINKAKHLGGLGLYFKDELITPTTIVRITPIELIEDVHDRYTITPPTPQD